MDSDLRHIHETAERWSNAVAGSDIDTLRELMTEDIVVIHGDGRILLGREAVVDDFVRGLANVRVVQRVESEETIVAGDWAFDRANVHTVVTRRSGGESREWHSRTITILRREGPGSWRVARAIGVVEQ